MMRRMKFFVEDLKEEEQTFDMKTVRNVKWVEIPQQQQHAQCILTQ